MNTETRKAMDAYYAERQVEQEKRELATPGWGDHLREIAAKREYEAEKAKDMDDYMKARAERLGR